MGFVWHSYTRDMKDATRHLKYIENRERYGEREERGLFDEHSERADRKEFLQKVEDPINRHVKAAKMHRLLFSMSGDEWNRSNFAPGDYQAIIRSVMQEWQIQKGIKVSWVAAEHRTEGHPHVHAVMPAWYEDRDGVKHRLNITDEDRKFFKEEFTRVKDRVRGFPMPSREERMKERNFHPLFNLERDIPELLFQELERKLHEEQFEREQAKSRLR